MRYSFSYNYNDLDEWIDGEDGAGRMAKRLVATWMGAGLAAWVIAGSGCAEVRYYNTTAWVEKEGRVTTDPWVVRFMENNYYFPVRDVFDPHVLASLVDSSQPRAWDTNDGGDVPDGSFYVNRDLASITAAQAAAGAATAPPKPPWKVVKARPAEKGTLAGFIGQDASGRKFVVKLDDPQHREAASAAVVIASRLYWLLGYHVPAESVVTITGTGVSDYDGRRGSASEFIDGKILGPFTFDWFRYRREMRGLRVAAAWVDDVDRIASNTLVTFRDGRSYYYLIDFDGTLGLWQGRPKPVWMGHRHLWDPPWGVVNLVSLGRLEKGQIRRRCPFSPAVGIFFADDFDPLAWKQEHPNSAFRFMTKADGRWMAEKIARITPEQLRAIVHAANYSDPNDEDHVLTTLLERRGKILQAFGVSGK